MSCHAQGRCHFCARKHTLTVFGSKKSEHDLMQKTNLSLIILDTVCTSCINLLDGFIKNKISNPAHQVELIKGKDTINKIFKSNIYLQYKQVQKDQNCNDPTIDKESKTEDALHKTNYNTTNNMNISKTDDIKKKSLLCLHCNFCHKQFNHTGDFNKHKRKHTREKPYLCHLCQQQFSYASNLARHKRMHSGEHPFLCEKCQCSFSRKDKFSQHLLSKH